MTFESGLMQLEEKIEKADSVDDLDYLRRVNKKEYWYTSILILGLFYGVSGEVGKMLLSLMLYAITVIIYLIAIYGEISLLLFVFLLLLIPCFYVIYASYRDQKYFNNQMESYILKRKKELKKAI